jgi:Conserved TM helix
MNPLDSFTSGFVSSWAEVWNGFAYYTPKLIGAIILLVIGLLVAGLLDQVVTQIFRALKLDSVVRKAGAEHYFSRAGVRLDVGKFLGSVVKWFVILVVVIQSLGILGLDAVKIFLSNILNYLPQVFVAVLILIAGAIIASALEKTVVGAAKAAGLGKIHLLGAVTRWSIWVFTIIVALYQLGIAAVFSETVFTAIVAALAIAFGLAFGLGGQQAAAEIIDSIRHNISERHQ